MTERDDSVHVVFGAAGAIGSAVVTELVHAGRDVRAVSRGGQAPDGAQGMAADVSDPVQAARAAAGASVIYHCSRPRASSRHCSGRCARRLTSSARPSSSTPANSKPPSATWNPPRTATRSSRPSPGTGPADRRPPRAVGDHHRLHPLRPRPACTSCAHDSQICTAFVLMGPKPTSASRVFAHPDPRIKIHYVTAGCPRPATGQRE